jgi:hypothetical protein
MCLLALGDEILCYISERDNISGLPVFSHEFIANKLVYTNSDLT